MVINLCLTYNFISINQIRLENNEFPIHKLSISFKLFINSCILCWHPDSILRPLIEIQINEFGHCHNHPSKFTLGEPQSENTKRQTVPHSRYRPSLFEQNLHIRFEF